MNAPDQTMMIEGLMIWDRLRVRQLNTVLGERCAEGARGGKRATG